MRIGSILMALVLLMNTAMAQELQQGPWFGNLSRPDGQVIRFHFDVRMENRKTVLYIINANERIKMDKVRYTKDSVFFELPVFESAFKARRISSQRWEGVWTKTTTAAPLVMPFVAETQMSVQSPALKPAVADVTGRWAVTFTRENGTTRPAIGEWQQKGNTLRGTFLTPTGDYRYLSGVIDGDSMRLSTFDGVHVFLLTAKINNDRSVSGGTFYSGPTGKETWQGTRNDTATLPDVASMYFKDGDEKVNFRFRNLDKKWVSLDDPKFRNKVVVIQIMGSWCPNCMDETAFLSEYYNQNKARGVEVIALAYEYSTDFDKARQSIEKFRKRFNVKYTMLNTGVSVGDTLRTEKTLPQFTRIKSFPSTIILNKKHRVAAMKAGFEGPGTGEHYEAMKKEFEETIDKLLRQSEH